MKKNYECVLVGRETVKRRMACAKWMDENQTSFFSENNAVVEKTYQK